FVDGRFLQSAGWEGEVDENSYFIDYEAQMVYISIDPAGKLIEITAYDNALTRTIQDCHDKQSDGKGFTMRGITFTQYAFRALEIEGKDPEGLSDEADHGKDVIGTTIEHCTITFCSRVAAYLRGDNLILRHCLVSDTSTEGIFILSSNDVLLERNIFRRNNIEDITGYYPAAVKIFNQCYRVVCNDNLVIDHPNSNGIWYDVGNVDGVFVNNILVNIGETSRMFNNERFWPSNNGFFFEISKGAICAGNVFVNCDQGIFVLNSNDVHIYNNTLVNSTVCIGRTTRSAEGDHFGWHPSTGPDVDKRDGHIFINNLLTGDENYHRPLLALWQMPVLCERLNKPQVQEFDYNVYVRRSKTSEPLIYWSPVRNGRCQEGYQSLTDLRQLHPEFEANSLYLLGYNGPLFKSIELGDYRLLQSSEAIKSSKQLPDKVLKHLGPENDKPFVGAYSPVE
ncbi:MAG: right-handed parallel beta-helix repeat-containing protein, partial [Phycisphaerae bacterium]